MKLPDHIEREQEFINKMLRNDSNIHALINRILLEAQDTYYNPAYSQDIKKTEFKRQPITQQVRKYVSLCLRIRYSEKEQELHKTLNSRVTNIPEIREQDFALAGFRSISPEPIFYPSLV